MAKINADKTGHIKKDPPKKRTPKPPRVVKTADQLRTEAGKDRVLKSLVKHLGVVSHACKAAKVSRSQYYAWIADDPEFKKAADEVADVALDFVESKLFSQIKSNNYVSTIFYLKTKGKSRGYVERTEVDARVSDGSTIIDWTGTYENNNSNKETTRGGDNRG